MIKPNALPGRSGARTAAILAAVIALLFLAREIFIPLAFAITLALVLSPAVGWLQKLRLGRVPSVILPMLVSLALAGGIGWIILNQMVDVVNELPSYRQNIHNKIEALRMPGKGGLERAAASVKEIGKELASAPPQIALPAPDQGQRTASGEPSHPVPVQIVAEPANEIEYVRALAKPVLAPLATFGIVLVFTVFLLIEQNDLRNRLFRLAGLDHLHVMTQALDDATQRVSRYLLLQLLVNAGFGVLCASGLYLIGVPYAVLWGAVAGILRIVPYVGSMVAALLPLLLSLAVFDQWLPPLLVFLLFATLEVVTGNFVEPWLYGFHMGISALALLFTTLFWVALWGPAGLILSTPLTVCAVVLGRHIPQLSFLYILLGDQPVLAADAQVYQRLLAMDDNEARSVANSYLAEHSLPELYDSLIIPALTRAEQDRHKGVLDPSLEESVFLSIREMIAEFSERNPPGSAAAASTGRIICLSANDEADEIAAAMLGHLLEQAGCAALSLPLDSAPQNMLSIVDPAENDLFLISAVPPFAFSSARTLSQLLQVRFPKTRVVIGVWGFTGDTTRALKRFQPAHPFRLVTSLVSAVEVCAASTMVATDDSVSADPSQTSAQHPA